MRLVSGPPVLVNNVSSVFMLRLPYGNSTTRQKPVALSNWVMIALIGLVSLTRSKASAVV